MALDVVKRGIGPSLLLVHGTGATSDFWGDAADRLAAHCQVITARGNHAMHLDNAVAWVNAAAAEACTRP